MKKRLEVTESRNWGFASGWVLIGFLAIAGFFLFSEHRAHTLSVLPWALLALCPLLHLFHGHGGHGGESGHRRGGSKDQ